MSYRCPKCSLTSYSESSFRDHLRYTHNTTPERMASESRDYSSRSDFTDSLIDTAVGFGIGALMDSVFDSGSSGGGSDWFGGGGSSGGGGASGDW